MARRLYNAAMLSWLMAGWLTTPQISGSIAMKPIVTAHVIVAVAAGAVTAGRVPLHVDVTPRSDMHVYAPGQPGYIGITLTLDADAPARVSGKPKYPAPRKLFMPVLNETQLVYSTPFRLTQDVTIPRTVSPGPLTIKGTLRYQACDDTICYKPVTLALTWTLANP
jgi:DsbC/DsbD-like thiol-disulfide interchange protein